DGLIMLDVIERDGRLLLSARFAAVKPGVVLDFAEFVFPLAETSQWSNLIVRRFEPLFPKLGILPRDAVAVSTLNLRSAIKSRDGEGLERQLNFLLFRRLMHEKQVFVLERSR